MKTAAISVAGAAVMAAVAGTVWAGRSSMGKAENAPPVIVELFTSEGCSSCPPADALLMRLEKQTEGVPIIALGQHVDYWNRLGWADPFSSKQFSDRQNEYAQSFRTDGVYTPQMVVDGQAEFVGSDEGRANSAIAAAARRPKANVTVSVQKNEPNSRNPSSNAWTLRATVGVLPGNVQAGEVFAALTESGLSSQVARGENAGRHLVHASVVRKLVAIGAVTSKGGAVSQSIVLPANLRKENVHAVVFVQEKANHRIVGAAQASLSQTGL